MPINARFPFFRQRLFRLRGILLTVTLTVLVLPLASLYLFRIYENELVQQTERELISQAAALGASYRHLLRTEYPEAIDYGLHLPDLPEPESDYQPILAKLNLINPIEPRRPPPLPTTVPIDSIAQTLGPQFKPVMIDTLHVTLSGIRLLDYNGTVIAGREEEGFSLAHIPEVKQALQGHYASTIRQRVSDQPPPPLYSISRGTLIRVFVAYPVIENHRLQAVIYLSRTPENILKHLYAVKEIVFAVSAGLVLLVALLVAFVSSTISRPIRELIKQTHQVRQGEQKQILPLSNPVTHEFAQLSSSFVDMSKTLNERSDYLRRFATHMSHEFKTPLTAMQGALELLHDHDETMAPEQRQRFIANLLADTLRLRQLVNRLLELARADAIEIRPQTCDIKVVLSELAQRFEKNELKIMYDSVESLHTAIAPEVLTMALFNLCENSLQHQADRIGIHSEMQNNLIELHLKDNGCGISLANQDKIFTPFFTTRRNDGGTGLGLAITTSLLKAYGGRIENRPSPEGAYFVIFLAAATHSAR